MGRKGSSGMSAGGNSASNNVNSPVVATGNGRVGSTVSNGQVTLTKVQGNSDGSGRWESDIQVYDAVALAGEDRRLVGSKTAKYHVTEDHGSFTVYEHSIYRTRRLKKVNSLQKAMDLMKR